MFEVLPDTLARAQRGICPTCGAPMNLAESGREARCDFCGGGSQLKFSLRAIEPEAAKLEKAKIKGATRWIEKQAKFEDCTCPGCGATFQANAAQAIQTCQYCGAQSKLETRLVPITTDDVPAPQERTDEDYQNSRRDRLDYPWDISTEQLFWRVINEPDLEQRMALATKFSSWSYINHTAAYFLPWLLKHLATDHDAVALAAHDVVGKLLCEGDPTLYPGVIQASRGVVFDAAAKPFLVHELGLGKGVCVKTLIDAAEFAAAHGANEYACNALWAVNTLIGRNFEEHPVIAQIVLYRMFYVSGPVLGWALYTMRSSYLRGRYPLEFLVRAIDELSIERPQVVQHLLDSIYTNATEDVSEFNQRLEWIRNAQAWGGRAAGFELLLKSVDDDDAMEAAMQLIEADIDHPQPGSSAEGALYRMITSNDATAPAIARLIERRGENLPDRIKREFIRRNPDTKLLDTSVKYYWQSEPKREFDAEMQKQLDDWRELIRSSVDRFRKNVDEMRKLLNEAKKTEPELFLREAPATLPMGRQFIAEKEAKAAEEKRRDDAQSAMETLQNDYQQQMEALSQKMMANMQDPQLMAKMTAEIQKLTTDFQQKMQQLMKGA